MKIGNYPSAGAQTTTGTYTGNDTVNRAIPHGLGVTPKLILIINIGLTRDFMIQQEAEIHRISYAVQEVTTPNATNFYVGNAASYVDSANDDGKSYRWAAID